MKRSALQAKWASQAPKRLPVRQAPAVKAQAFFKKRAPDQPELKFKDTTKGQTALASAGTIFNDTLLGMVEGNTDQTRIGNKICVKSVMLRGQAIYNPNGTVAPQLVRVLVYLDKQANGATAAVTDILAAAAFNSFNNLDNSDRFRTLAEETFVMPASGGYSAGNTLPAAYQFFLKAKLNLAVKYKGNAGSVADLASANIGVLVISYTDGVGTCGYTARVKFTDQ